MFKINLLFNDLYLHITYVHTYVHIAFSRDVLCGVIRCVTDRRQLAIDTSEGTIFGTLRCPLGGVTTT